MAGSRSRGKLILKLLIFQIHEITRNIELIQSICKKCAKKEPDILMEERDFFHIPDLGDIIG